ncbi:hypothetical protein T492DRAFT_485917 [Pavlovales sp. CCMP2436]|nr:hypothetical protein T492DRAFT_485917 [Pavlovales sp. CCMP2436]
MRCVCAHACVGVRVCCAFVVVCVCVREREKEREREGERERMCVYVGEGGVYPCARKEGISHSNTFITATLLYLIRYRYKYVWTTATL